MITFARSNESLISTDQAREGIRTILAELADDTGRLPSNSAILQETSCRILKFLGRDCRPFLRHVNWRILSMVASLARIVLVGDQHKGLRSRQGKVLQTLLLMVQPRIEYLPLPDEYDFILEEFIDVIELAAQRIESSDTT